jgi:hypothetical protein
VSPTGSPTYFSALAGPGFGSANVTVALLSSYQQAVTAVLSASQAVPPQALASMEVWAQPASDAAGSPVADTILLAFWFRDVSAAASQPALDAAFAISNVATTQALAQQLFLALTSQDTSLYGATLGLSNAATDPSTYQATLGTPVPIGEARRQLVLCGWRCVMAAGINVQDSVSVVPAPQCGMDVAGAQAPR